MAGEACSIDGWLGGVGFGMPTSVLCVLCVQLSADPSEPSQRLRLARDEETQQMYVCCECWKSAVWIGAVER